jgi:hypothetical protein
VRELMPYGTIGSHGGWAHNWFAAQLVQGSLSPEEAADLIRRNDRCLERVVGRPVRSYAAPEGVQPPFVTKLLGKLGITSYYYTGDTGGPPNLSFLSGRMLTRRAWAFPVMPNGQYASIGEMIKFGHIPPAAVLHWLDEAAAYAAYERSIRLVYSHPYDVLPRGYAAAFGRFLDRVESLERRGLLTVEPMPDYASFLTRLVRTRFSFQCRAGTATVRLSNGSGLRSVAFAVPARLLAGRVALPTGVVEVAPSRGERVFAVRSDVRRLELRLPAACRPA